MSKKLANIRKSQSKGEGSLLTAKVKVGNNSGSALTFDKDVLFKISLDIKLDNGYNFSKMNKEALREFDHFIEQTTHRNLTISEVEKMFLRKKGNPFEEEVINGKKQKVIHLGKDKKPFRIFGFYDENGEFVVYRLDPRHKKHKSN